MKVANRGTNFSATKEADETILDLVEENKIGDYIKIVKTLDKKEFGIFKTILKEFIKKNNLHYDDPRITFNIRKSNKRLVFTIGRRYSLLIQNKRGKTKCAFVSKEPFYKDSTTFTNNHETVAYWNRPESFKPHYDDALNGLNYELSRDEKSPFKKYQNKDFVEDIFEVKLPTTNEIKDEFMIDLPLNTILYGPPGTGKTYNTVFRAAEIIEYRKIDDYNEAKLIFKQNLHDRIEFITFHQNYSYEDFIQGLRPDTENDKELTFERKDGVFKDIADRALKNLKESDQPLLVKKPFEEVFNQFINPLIEGEVEEIEVKMKKVSYFITAITNKSIDFRKSNGNTSHTLSLGTLKKMYEAESVLDIQGLSSYYTPLLEVLLLAGKNSKGQLTKIDKKNYVIIIDEINRANISRVFGELITLIEPDKRSHGEIPMEARLPSGDKFIVPSNLFIIGTMNTADKSIALLDIALRRRFEFESMYPKYEIEDHEIYDVEILKSINKQIIDTKGHDFQIGHSYFMGENNDLVKRMNLKVIPLLMEYYMNDEKEVKSILINAGLQLEEDHWPLRITGKRD